MNTLLAFIAIGSLIGAIVGVIMCLPRSMRRRGAIISSISVATLFLSLITLGSRLPESHAATTKQETPTAVSEATYSPPPQKLTKGEMVRQFRISALAWKKDGFGSVMIASFIIHNDNQIAVKDIKVACSSSGPSGSVIDSNARTIFEKIEKRSYLEVSKLNMGFIRSEVVDTKCKVVDFTMT